MNEKLTKAEVENLTNYLHPETAKEALERWDENENIFTIEMGGLGPGYEQRIHIAVFEIIRDASVEKLEEYKNAGNDHELNEYMNNLLWSNWACKKLGLSGAQARAAKNLAYYYIIKGYRKTLEIPEMKERHIQVQKYFP